MRAKPCLLSASFIVFSSLLLASCIHHAPPPARQSAKISGPSDFKRPRADGSPSWEVDVSKIPDAVPRPHNGPYKNGPYQVFGKTYYPLASAKGYREVGQASWYGTQFHSKPTANGEIYDLYGMTAAHKTLPLPSYVRVTNLHNGKNVILRVNDRGPFHSDRIIDLSFAAARKLGFAESGTARVQVEAIDPREWQAQNRRWVLPSSAGSAQKAQDNPQVAALPDSGGAKKKRAARSLWPVSPSSSLRQSRSCRAAEEPSAAESFCSDFYQSAGSFGADPAPRSHRSNQPTG